MDPSTTTIHVRVECGGLLTAYSIRIAPDGTREVVETHRGEDDGVVTVAMLVEAVALDLERRLLGE